MRKDTAPRRLRRFTPPRLHLTTEEALRLDPELRQRIENWMTADPKMLGPRELLEDLFEWGELARHFLAPRLNHDHLSNIELFYAVFFEPDDEVKDDMLLAFADRASAAGKTAYALVLAVIEDIRNASR